ncbi:hypothetical protein [Mycolicibacter kumamotonensis]|uniref:hypothetical protein n=1 Tax=Mycolicibacter kumamotonensis TaxID=354243 RepID=UPI001041F510|nr:hypothetical protein [Mycolicibacter kumamotonensis]
MPSLKYVGPEPSRDSGIATKLATENYLQAQSRQTYTTDQIAAQGSDYATKGHADELTSDWASQSYYQTQDALNILKTELGHTGGIASLDGDGKLPAAQIPALGFGTFRGRWGVSATYAGSTGTTPMKIAQFDLGVTGWSFQPWVFLVAQLQVSLEATPAVEVRIGDITNDTTYDSQTLVASGIGRYAYNDLQAVVVRAAAPIGSMANGVQTSYSPNLNARLTVWAFNKNESNPAGQISASQNSVSGAAYIMRIS